MKLSRIPEPSEEKVRDRIDSEEMDRLYLDESDRIVDSWEIQTAVNSYLWENWKHTLKKHSIGWTDFQTETKFANNTIEAWAGGKQDWDAVLSGHAKELEANLE